MGTVVIVAYRARPGHEPALIELLRRHHGILRLQGLVTDFAPVFMRSKDGAYLEIFEWKGQAAIEASHKNASVKEMWARFEAACEFVRFADLAEAGEVFPGFERVVMPKGL